MGATGQSPQAEIGAVWSSNLIDSCGLCRFSTDYSLSSFFFHLRIDEYVCIEVVDM